MKAHRTPHESLQLSVCCFYLLTMRLYNTEKTKSWHQGARVVYSVNEFQTTNQQKDYKGKKLSISEGLGTTGKVFKSQKEALEFGKQEIKRLAEGDKKSRQFSISKVTAEDGSLVGWTVDVFEDNSVEKVVSNPIENITENNKDKDKEKNKE